jgi:hypothetical protein
MPAKTVHGGRAQLIVSDPNTGDSRVVGIFNSVSFGLTYDVQPVFLLGRMSPDELVYTAQEAVSVTASGFRVVGADPHIAAKVPLLQDLLVHEYIEMAVFDRQTGVLIARIHSLRPTGYNTTISARNLEEVTCSFTGLLLDTESSQNAEAVGASSLP